MLNNDKITLKPLSIKDTDFILELRNDLEIADQFFSDAPVYDFEHNSWLNSRNSDDLDFIIVENESQKKAGRIYLNKVDFRHQKGEYGIVLHPEFRGKKLAYEASVLLIKYVFESLPIHKIYLEVFSENEKAVNLYKRLGFEQEGLLKDEFLKNGLFKDVIRMSLVKKS